MKLRKISFKIISMIMVLTMLFSISATTISAVTVADHDHSSETVENKKNPIYVSLGDSMTNGYGLPGYDGNTGVEDYGNGSYANQFAEYLNAEKHYQLAMSAMRVEDLHWILEVDYTDEAVIELIEKLSVNPDPANYGSAVKYYKANIEEFNELWYSVFSTGDFWTWRELVHDYRFDVAAYCIEGKDNGKSFSTDSAYKAYTDVQALQIVAEYYQNAIKSADVISLGIGNGNFGVFMFGRITEAIGFNGTPDEALIYQVENAVKDLDPAMQAKVLSLKSEIAATMGKVMAEGGAFGEEALDALINTMLYTVLSFVLNYMGTVDAIIELNPNADIISLALMNTFGGNDAEFPVDFEDIDSILNGSFDAMATVNDYTLGDLLALLYTPLNSFIAAYPTYLQLKGQVVESQIIKIETLLQDEIAKIETEANAKVDALVAVAEGKLAVLNEQLKSATGVAKIKIQNEISKIKADLETAIEAIEAEVEFNSNAVVDKFEAQLNTGNAKFGGLVSVDELETVVELAIAELVAEANAKIAAITATAEEQLYTLNAMLQGVVGEKKAEIEAEIAAIEAARDELIAKVDAELAVKVPVLEAELAAKLAELQVKADEAYAIAVVEIEAAIAEIEAQLPTATAEAKAELQAQLIALQAELEVIRDEINAEFYALMDDVKAEIAAEIEVLKAEAKAEAELYIAEAKAQLAVLNAELELLTNDALSHVPALKAQIAKQLNVVKDIAEDQLNVLYAKLADAAEEQKPAIEAEINAVKAEYKKQLEAIEAYCNAEIEKLHAIEAEVKAEIVAEINKINSELNAVVKAIKAELEIAINEVNAKVESEMDATVNTIVAEIEAITAELNSTILTIQSDLKLEIAKLKAEAEKQVAGVKDKFLDKIDSTNNKFFYAEAEKVECLVDVYEDELKNKDSIIRDRFVESIVGADGKGMIWAMLGLDPIVIDTIEYYESLTASEKIDLGMAAYPVIVYLAFEKAIVDSIDGASVSVGSVLGIGNFNLDASLITGGMSANLNAMLNSNLVKGEDGTYTSDAYFKDAGKYVDNVMTETLNGYLKSFGVTYQQVDLATLANKVQEAVAYGVISQTDAANLLALYIFKTEVSNTCAAVRYASAKKNMVKAFTDKLGYPEEQAKLIVDALHTQVYDGFELAYSALATKDALAKSILANDQLAGLISLFARCIIGNGLGGHPSQGGHDSIYAAIVDSYENGYTTKDETLNNLKNYVEIFNESVVRYHDEAYAYAYAELYKKGVITDLQDLLIDIADELDTLEGHLYDIENELDPLYADVYAILMDEISVTQSTLNKLIKLLDCSELDAKTWAQLDSLLADLELHLANIVDFALAANVVGQVHTNALIEDVKVQAQHQINVLKTEAQYQISVLEQQAQDQIEILKGQLADASEDAKQHILNQIAAIETKLNNQIAAIQAEFDAYVAKINAAIDEVEFALSVVDAFVADLNANADVYLYQILSVAYADLVDAVVAAAKKFAPEADAWLYDWFYNNPDKVIEFFTEYGDEMVEFVDKYSEEIFVVIGFIAVNYGPEVLEYVIYNGDEVLAGLVEWVDTYGERILKIVAVYLDALGISFEFDIQSPDFIFCEFDCIIDILAEIVEKIESGVISQIEALDLINKLEAAIAGLESELLSAVEGLVEELKAHVIEQITILVQHVYDAVMVFVSEELLSIVLDAINKYAPELADWAYNWLYNNPEKVIAFFVEYGDDMINFLNAHSTEIVAIIAFIVYNFGDEIAEYVVENADVILAALVSWFEIHGENTWALIKVYLKALYVYFDLDLDLSSPEGLINAFNKVIVLLGQLLDMINDGIYDQLEALGLLSQVEAALAELKAYLLGIINDKIEDLKDFINEQIDALKAQIQAQIDALKAQLKDATDELKAELEKQIAALEKLLEAYIKAELDNLDNVVLALKDLLLVVAGDLGDYIYEAISDYVDTAVKSHYTPKDDSYYVAVNGGEAGYAELLAESLNLKENQVGYTTWDNLDYEELAKADLITVGFDENEISAFAIEQLLAYVANYADVTLRDSVNSYVNDVFASLEAELSDKIDLDLIGFSAYQTEALTYLNSTIDSILSYDLIADKELADMDWAALVGDDNVHYIDEAREYLRNQILAAGVMETFTYTIDVVAYIYDNADELGIASALAFLKQDYAYEVLGENAYYTIEVPVADAMVFAAESYLYGYIQFSKTYGQLVVDLYEINPTATVILLGAYNAYDVEFTLGDITLELGEAYSIVSGISSVQPFVYSLLSENIGFVDITDAATNYDTYVEYGFVDNSILSFLALYLVDNTITDVSFEGNEYIHDQIMAMLTVGCDHKYDNACDADCNKCGAIRVTAGHSYDGPCDAICNICGDKREGADHVYSSSCDVVCNVCGHVRASATAHVYDNCMDSTCNNCGAVRTDVSTGHVYKYCTDTVCALCGTVREKEAHAFDGCEDTTCYKCDYVRTDVTGHVYDNCDDTTCNNCDNVRVAVDHVYANACDTDCDRCGATRTVGAHVYSGCTDVDCNNCGEKRTASAHVTEDCVSTVCKVCGTTVSAVGHKYGDWKVTTEPTKKACGVETRTCAACGKTQTREIGNLPGGLTGGAIAAIVIASVAVTGAAGFAIYWFLIQKKTFAQLLALFNKPAAGAPAADAPAADAPAADAPAAEEAPAEEAPAEEAPAEDETPAE